MKLINNITKHVFVMLIVLANNHQLMAMNNESAEFSVNEKTIKQSWNFVAYLDDEEIGYHNFEVVQNNGNLVVKTQAKFDVSFMFIPLYSYEHKNTEIWRNNCLISLDSSTLDDGEKLFVNLSNKNGNTRIITPDNNITKTSCIRSFAYWDYELINSKVLLNVQTGELIDVNYRFVGSELININYQPVDARRYQLMGEDQSGNSINIDLWYNSNNHWIALQSRLDNGRSLRYQLTQESVK